MFDRAHSHGLQESKRESARALYVIEWNARRTNYVSSGPLSPCPSLPFPCLALPCLPHSLPYLYLATTAENRQATLTRKNRRAEQRRRGEEEERRAAQQSSVCVCVCVLLSRVDVEDGRGGGRKHERGVRVRGAGRSLAGWYWVGEIAAAALA